MARANDPWPSRHVLEGWRRPSKAASSSVQSQSDRFTSTSRIATPCSRASRTSWAGGIEAHGLGVQHRGAEDVGIEGLEPAGRIDEQREGSGVALRKAIFAEPLDLLETARCELLRVSLLHHRLDQPVAVEVDGAVAAERRHGAAQLVGFARRKAANVDGDLHRLLLEQRNAERALQESLRARACNTRPSRDSCAAEIGMHHVTLDRARRTIATSMTRCRISRLQARQHRHLRARFDLEDTERVGAADHVVDIRFLAGRDRKLTIGSPWRLRAS